MYLIHNIHALCTLCLFFNVYSTYFHEFIIWQVAVYKRVNCIDKKYETTPVIQCIVHCIEHYIVYIIIHCIMYCILQYIVSNKIKCQEKYISNIVDTVQKIAEHTHTQLEYCEPHKAK